MANGRGDRFAYDDEGQLVEAWYNATDPANSGGGNTRYDGFAYDALGNRTQNNYVASRGLTSFVRRDNGLNQYSSWMPSIIYHDDNSPWPGYNAFPGNGVTMADGWLVASYNALNQPVAMVPFGWSDAIYFGYDPLGRCVKRWVGASGDVYSNPATYFHYDGWNLLQEGNNAWGPARVYVHGNRVDEIVWSYNTFTGEQAYHHYDARGHCTLLTDSSGNILEQYEYDAFGQPYFYDASGNSIGAYDAQGRWAGYSLFGNRFLFTGREWLSDVKLYDYRNRMYQPELGRFLQPDPKEFEAGDYNLYRYCQNDPVNSSDPMGLASLTMFGGGDWIKGSDGLSAWDREVGGMPSNRWQAGPNGAGGGGDNNAERGRANGPDEATIQKSRRILARQTKEGEDTTGAIVDGKPVPGDRNWKGEQVPYRFGKPVYVNPNASPSLKRVHHIEEPVPPGRSDVLSHYHTRTGFTSQRLSLAEPSVQDMRALKTTGAMLFSNPYLKAEGAYRIYRNGVPSHETRYDLYNP